MAGFLAAQVQGDDLGACLEAASAQAAVALSSRHLHPALDALV
jgi:sugar/nucleoside kinase (ribokinase family)